MHCGCDRMQENVGNLLSRRRAQNKGKIKAMQKYEDTSGLIPDVFAPGKSRKTLGSGIHIQEFIVICSHFLPIGDLSINVNYYVFIFDSTSA